MIIEKPEICDGGVNLQVQIGTALWMLVFALARGLLPRVGSNVAQYRGIRSEREQLPPLRESWNAKYVYNNTLPK